MNTTIASTLETIGATPVVTFAAAGVAAGKPTSSLPRPHLRSGHAKPGTGHGQGHGVHRPT